jgi:hypothetical protein
MKNLLRFFFCGLILNSSVYPILTGQIILISEDFSGFTTGTHSTPSTSDVSSSLDLKMHTAGWTGFKIYSAGGEIKSGTEAITGWIESPSMDLSGNGGRFEVKVDICRWPGDATTVRILHNGEIMGTLITPTDNFETILLSGEGGTINSKIRIQAVTKRFFLDNFFVITEGIPTNIPGLPESRTNIKIYPVPVNNILHLSSIQGITRIEIYNISGRLLRVLNMNRIDETQIDVESLNEGVYFIHFISGNYREVRTFIK